MSEGATKTNTRPVHVAVRSRNLSWYGRLCAALHEVGRSDLAARIGHRGPDRIYTCDGVWTGQLLPGGSCPTFVFTATEGDWDLIWKAFKLTNSARPGFPTHAQFVDVTRRNGRILPSLPAVPSGSDGNG